MEYQDVIKALRTIYGGGSAASTQNFAVRVTHVGIYGGVSTTISGSSESSVQDIVVLEDAYTGRQVRGYSTPVKRARAGLVVADIRAMKWYDAGNTDTIAEKHICYFRRAESEACLSGSPTQYDVIVRGYAKISRNIGSCT